MSEVERPMVFLYVIAAIAVALVGARYLQAQASAEPAAATGQSYLEQAPTGKTGEARIVVHVTGAVKRPGVFSLAAGSRAADAIRRAGGFGPDANASGLNLAAKLADGQQVVVPATASQAGGTTGVTAGAEGPISLNSATAEQLDELDGIGPALAQKILEAREQRGGFASVDDLADVPGIGDKRLESLRSRLQP